MVLTAGTTKACLRPIEDDLLITETGCEVLTLAPEKELIVIYEGRDRFEKSDLFVIKYAII